MLVRMWSPYYTKQRRSTTSLHPRSSVNNDPDNLQVVTRRQHFYMHMVRDYDGRGAKKRSRGQWRSTRWAYR